MLRISMTQYAALMESRSLEADDDDDFERDWKGINPCDLDFLCYSCTMAARGLRYTRVALFQ